MNNNTSVNLKILGTGSYLPEKIITNEAFAGRDLYHYSADGSRTIRYSPQTEMFDEIKPMTNESIFRVSGIKERRMSAPDEWPSDMAYKAAKEAIENAGIDKNTLAGIIFSTITERQNVSSAASKLQERLGIKRSGMVKDINGACAGYSQAVIDANSLNRTYQEGNYLVVAAECLTKIVDYSDLNSTLFGDGAGAAVLVPAYQLKGEKREGIVATYAFSESCDGNVDAIYTDQSGLLRMPNGQKVLKNAARSMIECAAELKKIAGWDRADVYIPHQANSRIIELVSKEVGQESAKVYSNIEKYGNTSSATCAIALDEAIKDGTITSGKRVIMVGFGAGFLTSGVAMQF